MATVRRLFQRADSRVPFAHRRPAITRMFLLEVVGNALQVRCSCWSPADTHSSGTQHLLEASVHFLFLNELTPVGLRNPLADDGAEARVLWHPQCGLFHEALGIGSSNGGNLRKLSAARYRIPLGTVRDWEQ